MSLSTYLESKNKDLLNSLCEWQEKVRQSQVIIDAKDKRIADLEKQISLRDGLLEEEYALRATLTQEWRDMKKEAAHWKFNHDNQKALKSQLMDRPDLKVAVQKFLGYARTGRVNDSGEVIHNVLDWQMEELIAALNDCQSNKPDLGRYN